MSHYAPIVLPDGSKCYSGPNCKRHSIKTQQATLAKNITDLLNSTANDKLARKPAIGRWKTIKEMMTEFRDLVEEWSDETYNACQISTSQVFTKKEWPLNLDSYTKEISFGIEDVDYIDTMESQAKYELDPEPVKVSDILLTQDDFRPYVLNYLITGEGHNPDYDDENQKTSGSPVWGYRKDDGKVILIDGHHRYLKAKVLNESTLSMVLVPKP